MIEPINAILAMVENGIVPNFLQSSSNCSTDTTKFFVVIECLRLDLIFFLLSDIFLVNDKQLEEILGNFSVFNFLFENFLKKGGKFIKEDVQSLKQLDENQTLIKTDFKEYKFQNLI